MGEPRRRGSGLSRTYWRALQGPKIAIKWRCSEPTRPLGASSLSLPDSAICPTVGATRLLVNHGVWRIYCDTPSNDHPMFHLFESEG
jgi:hypothetical protein